MAANGNMLSAIIARHVNTDSEFASVTHQVNKQRLLGQLTIAAFRALPDSSLLGANEVIKDQLPKLLDAMLSFMEITLEAHRTALQLLPIDSEERQKHLNDARDAAEKACVTILGWGVDAMYNALVRALQTEYGIMF